MHIDTFIRSAVGASAKRSAYQDFAHTADLSAFAGCSTLPLNLLKLIIGPLGGCDDVRIKKLLCINCQVLFFKLNLA